MSAPPDPGELIGIARIVRPRGLRGEVVADLLTDYPERFSKQKSVWLKLRGGRILPLVLEDSWFQKDRIILKFAGYDSTEAAEELRDSVVSIPREELVELPADTYFDFDLVDCTVVTAAGKAIGRVTEVQRYGAAPILTVKDDGGREFLIPFVRSICIEVDPEGKQILIDPPDGLLELD